MRPRTILLVVLLIVAPTGLLSLVAAWHVREREQLIDARIQSLARNAVWAAARQVRQKLEGQLSDVRDAVSHALNTGGGSPEISAAVTRMRGTHAAITDVYVFMNPWGFLHPVIAGGRPAADPRLDRAADPSPTELLAEVLRTRIAAAPAWDETLGVAAAGHAFCFTRLEQRRGLYVGYRINPQEAQQIIRRALLDFSGGGIALGVSAGPARTGQDAGQGGTEGGEHPPPVLVYDSLSGTTREIGGGGGPASAATGDGSRPPRAGEPRARLASVPLDPPFDHLVVTATAADVGAMREAEIARIHLLRWGIGLLAVTVMAGLGVVLREVAAELSRARARSEFVIGVSHDLRTPLASMKMLAESLLAGRVPQPERQKQFLGTMVRECDRLHQLVERVLYFVRFGQNALVFRRRVVDAVSIVREAAEAFAAGVGAEVRYEGAPGQPSDAGAGATLPAFQRFSLSGLPSSGDHAQTTLPPHSPIMILADAAAITQVILNLLDNAWKYSGGAHGHGVVCDVSRAREWVCIAVTDRGVGMSRREQRRLFRRFHRGAHAMNANVSGVGLGLAMCRHIVRRHGGRIAVESEQGRGSTFTVWLRGR